MCYSLILLRCYNIPFYECDVYVIIILLLFYLFVQVYQALAILYNLQSCQYSNFEFERERETDTERQRERARARLRDFEGFRRDRRVSMETVRE